MNKWLREVVFIRFFQHLLQSAPKLFYLYSIFIIVQLTLLFIKLEVTPFFLFGMYSEKIPRTDTIFIRKTLLNNKLISQQPIPLISRYVLETGLDNYMRIKKNDNIDIVKSRVETKYEFLTASFIYPLIKDKIFNPSTSAAAFEQWFKDKANTYSKEFIKEVTVLQEVYLVDPILLTPQFIKTDTLAQF